jgi:ornithine carbamoyltransferase
MFVTRAAFSAVAKRSLVQSRFASSLASSLDSMKGEHFISIDQLRYVCMDGCMHAWMDACMHACRLRTNSQDDMERLCSILNYKLDWIGNWSVSYLTLLLAYLLTYLLCLLYSNDELKGLLDLSHQYKATYDDKTKPLPKPLDGHSVSMIFQKRSTRTRVSTETGMSLLGGHALFLGPSDVQLGVNESMRDTASVLSGFNSLILARVFGHKDITELAKYATVPIINALSDLHHPLQTLADLMALQQHFGKDLKGKTVAWVGDGNNVLHDLMLGSVKMGMNIHIATPKGYEPDAGILAKTQQLAKENGVNVLSTTVADEAVAGSDVVVTDTWVSMGQEDEYAKRVAEFDGYEVNTDLMAKANPGAVFLHCLPRHSEEVTDDVFYSDASLVFPEAENRMWTVMAVMAAQLGKVE